MSENSLALPLVSKGDDYENYALYLNGNVRPARDSVLCIVRYSKRSRRESGEDVPQMERGTRWT